MDATAPPPPPNSPLHWSARVAAALLILIGGIGLLGWAADLRPLTSVWPMVPNAAVAFMVSGIALLRLRGRASFADLRVIRVCALVVAALGVVTLGEHIAARDFGIDRLLFPEASTTSGAASPGRMPVTAAAGFAMAGVGLALLHVYGALRGGQYLLLATGALGLVNVIVHTYGPPAGSPEMGLPAAAGFVILSLGGLLGAGRLGLMTTVTGKGAGSFAARRLLPGAVIVPFVFGWLALGGQRAGFYGPQFGVTLLTLSSIAVLAGFVWWSAAALDRLDVARRGADEALRRGYDDLGGLIAQRTSALHASQVDVRAEISGRVRSEAQAKSHQERVRKILETAYDGFVALDQSGVIVEWNRQAEEMFGWPREEMLGRSFADAVIPEPQRAAHVEELRRFLESGDGPTRNKRLQLYVARRDGHEFPVELTVWATMAEDTYTFSAFIHDISERTQAEMLNARLVAIVQYSGDAILAMSPLGEILSWNTAAQRLYGYAADEVVGRSVSMLTPPAGRDDIKDLLSHVAEGAPSQQCETTHATKARGLIEVSLSLSPIRDASGRLLGVSGIIRDVTEQRRADAAHRETEKLRFVAQLANAASHEINNPLTVIAAQMVMMEQEYERDEQSQKRFERIDEALKRIRDISARLRHLSRLEVADGAPGGSEMLDLTKSSPPDDVPSAPDR